MIRAEAVCRLVRDIGPGDLEDWIARGWVCPTGEPPAWLFAETDIARVTLVRDLRLDVGIEPDALGLVLSLLDQLYATRHTLQAVLSGLPAEDVRRAALEASGREPK